MRSKCAACVRLNSKWAMTARIGTCQQLFLKLNYVPAGLEMGRECDNEGMMQRGQRECNMLVILPTTMLEQWGLQMLVSQNTTSYLKIGMTSLAVPEIHTVSRKIADVGRNQSLLTQVRLLVVGNALGLGPQLIFGWDQSALGLGGRQADKAHCQHSYVSIFNKLVIGQARPGGQWPRAGLCLG